MSAFNTQVNGNHYQKYKIQPMQFAMQANLNALQFSVVKYITRYRDKNQLIDLQNASHCVEMLEETTKHITTPQLSQFLFLTTFQNYLDSNQLDNYQCLTIQELAFNQLDKCKEHIATMMKEYE